ncbi:hypothetical protein ACTXT7_016306, partial [Hymenolepis weldensis]
MGADDSGIIHSSLTSFRSSGFVTKNRKLLNEMHGNNKDKLRLEHNDLSVTDLPFWSSEPDFST